MSRSRISLILTLVLAHLLPQLHAASFDEKEIFIAGQSGYHTFRIPALVRSKSGTLLAFCEGRKSSAHDSGDIDLVLRRSTDNGSTWGPLSVVWSDADNTCGNPSPVLDHSTGTIWMLSTWNLGTDSEHKIIDGSSKDTRRVFKLSSRDDGVTWSSASDITASTKKASWTWYATGPGAGIQLSRGKQAGRLIIACDHITADHRAFGSHVIYSDDHGITWQIGAVADSSATVRPNENLAVELVQAADDRGSRLFFHARDHQGPHSRATAYSTDGGLSYTGTAFKDAPHFVTPTVQAGLRRFKATDAGDAADRILFSCCDSATRSRMAIWSSRDETLTWSAPKLIYEGPSAYSDMSPLSDGRMALLYEKGKSNPYETITFSRFDEAWLDLSTPAVP